MTLQETAKRNKEEWTLAHVAEATLMAGQFYFHPILMRVAGDARKHFVVICRGEDIYLKRVEAPKLLPTGTLKVGQLYPFDPKTGRLSPVAKVDHAA
ncbi:MAG: hypothetical protein EOO38_01655 [Cytophagaceae bacterium]|nr:MAG: hypothetical protein EOO38_01655 [Cytophagaceae bacterium]